MMIYSAPLQQQPIRGDVQDPTELDRVVRRYRRAFSPAAYRALVDSDLDRKNVHLVDLSNTERLFETTTPPAVVLRLGSITHSQNVSRNISHG